MELCSILIQKNIFLKRPPTVKNLKTNILFLGIIISIVISCNDKNATIKLEDLTSNSQFDVKAESANTKNKPFKDSAKSIEAKYFIGQLDNTNGLSNSSVNTIFQDSENLLWIGTWDGLNRYDGSKFKIFRPELNNENSLSNQVILKIGEDNTGQIWILTMHGINQYDKKKNIFHRYYFSRKNNPPLTESEFNMALDGSKNVFCAVKDWGFGYFDGNDFQLLNAENLPQKSVKKMEFTPTGELSVLFENNELYELVFKDIEIRSHYLFFNHILKSTNNL